jgi:hypothetical protein
MKRTAIIKRSFGMTVFLAFVLAGFYAEADKVWYNDGRVQDATSVRYKKPTQEYIITIGGTELPVPKAQIKRVEVNKPATYDQAAAAVQSGAMAQAIPVLEGLALDAAPASISLDMQRRAWAALTATKDSSLAAELDKTIAKGSRENAAAAHIARGDMAKADGNKPDALLDYLRVVVLYDQIKSIQPEALYKTVQCLEELKDPRAEDWRKRLMSDYGSSEWAQKR